MILSVYLLIAIIFSGTVLYKYNKKRYTTYFIITLITVILGIFFEENGMSKRLWTWNTGTNFIFQTPIEMILIYIFIGICVSVLTVYLKNKCSLKMNKCGKSLGNCVLPLSFLGLLLIPIHGISTAVLITFLFLGTGFFLRYQNLVIMIAGASGAAIDVVFDTILTILNVCPYDMPIPFLTYFTLGMFISGLTIFIDEKIKK